MVQHNTNILLNFGRNQLNNSVINWFAGGLRKAAFNVSGRDIYKFMKYEGGVHRVQRVPKTEKGGRMHTSTMSVVVLPTPTEVSTMSVVVLPTPTVVSTMSVVLLPTPTVVSTMSIVVLPTPTEVSTLSVAVLPTPTEVSTLSVTVLPTPTEVSSLTNTH